MHCFLHREFKPRAQSQHKADREVAETGSREWRDLRVKQQDFTGTPGGVVA